ncbi:MAG: ABC transporter substrate-binding protein [Alphaproteobacteria bacterium]|nr:ABC transporter substrate-binding protein [Alphaproteobacteria bacterium]
MKKLLFLLSFCINTQADAEDLHIGLRADITSVDPHFHVSGPNSAMASHMFESLVKQDNNQKLLPGLALSWEKESDLIWAFNLRENVKFHNDQAFEAKDVVYTINRIQKGIGPLESYKTYIRFIDKVEIVNPHKIKISTIKPYPLLAWDIAMIGILPHSLGENLDSHDFNQAKTAIGTGPYRFVSWRPGQDIIIEKNNDYWGNKEPWDKVIFKPVPQDISRFNALLADDFDFIETVPVEELYRFKETSKFKLFATIPSRLMYLCMDLGNKISPYVLDMDGKALTQNPFQDKRVREALSYAINREFLIQHYLGNHGKQAGQLIIEGSTGFNPDLKAHIQDIEKAKQLMKEAGYEKGFQVVFSSTSGRYVNDTKIVQAIASMLEQIKIKAKVEILPSNVFFSRSQKGDFSLSLGGWPVGRESLSPLQALFHRFDIKEGHGVFNRGRYANQELDVMIETALETMDDVKREELLKKANRVVVEDLAIIPLYFSIANWSGKESLTFEPRMDEYTIAMNVKKLKN